MAAPLIVRLVMDAAGYLKTVDTAIASNTELDKSFQGVGQTAAVSADRQVAASLKASKALEAQIAGYRVLAADATQSAEVQARATLLADSAQARYNRSMGLTAVATGRASTAARTGERDFNKLSRGLLAGSGAASSLGRSLAFASSGFIAFATGATLIKASISAAVDLEKTQRQVNAQLKTSGKSWSEYGARVTEADLKLSHLSGFTNQELLQGFGYLVRVNGNVSESIRLTGVAADVARGRNISLASAAIALAKAWGGSDTALKRLGITIPKTVKGMDALNYVAQKFSGQAAAGATVGDKFHAVLVDTEETIGTALLPTFTRLATSLGNWLAKMNETGRLQRDVNEVIHIAGTVFHALGGIIHTVDRVTGGFANTLKLIGSIWAGLKIAGWITSLKELAGAWGLVGGAATKAAAAEETAVGGAGVAGAAGAAGASGVVSRVSQYTGGAAGGAAASRFGGVGLAGSLGAAVAGGFAIADQQQPTENKLVQNPDGSLEQVITWRGKVLWRKRITTIPGTPVVTAALRAGGDIGPSFFPRNIAPGFFSSIFRPGPTGPFGGAQPQQVNYFGLTLMEQIAQARAALTLSTKDDVVLAKRIIARIKGLIDRGITSNAQYLKALQDLATAEGVLQTAQQAAAAKRQAAAAKALQIASTYTTPIDLQLAQARAELTASNADDIRVLKQIIAAARRALAAGKKNKQGQLAILQTILQAQQALQSLTSQNNTTFTLPLKLQLALAKAQALGTDITPILLRMKAALEKALKAAKGNIQKQIDIYNQIASINAQLNSSVTNAYGDFKQASVKALTAGLGLTAAQRRALEAKLSQRGPGGTVPAGGTTAGGYIIDPATGRPIHRHHRPRHSNDYTAGGTGGSPQFNATIDLNVYIDGKHVEATVTRQQQRRRRHNPSSRRGPNAATAAA